MNGSRVVRGLRAVAFGVALGLGVSASFAADAARAASPWDAPRATTDAPLRAPAVPVSFLSHDGGWLRVEYPPSARDRIGPLVADADDARAELAEALGQPVLRHVEVRVARGPEEMATLAPEGAPPPAGASGAAYPSLELIVVSLGTPGSGDAVDVGEAFRHELSHVAVEQAVSTHPVPRWLAEGFAVHTSREQRLSRSIALGRAALAGRWMPIADVERSLDGASPPSSLALAESADFVRFLRGPKLAALIERLGRGETPEASIAGAYGASLASLEGAWREEAMTRYGWTPALSAIVAISLASIALAWARARRRSQRAAASDSAPPASDAREPRRRAARERSRVRIVLARKGDRLDPSMLPDPEVPKIEHDGRWHTLH